MRLTILHTNDIHGREGRIAQISTIVRREKERSDHPVLYLDGGDVEDNSNRLSSLTKGNAMHRLLSLASCDAATVGNATWLRYGPASVGEHTRVSSYPQLAANFRGIDGVVPSVLLGTVGVLGLSAEMRGLGGGFDWGFERLDILATARATAGDLRARGAELVVLLSHLGLEVPEEAWDDRRLVPELQDEIDIVIGAHSHDLLPHGEWIGRVLVTQAGQYGEHIGRIEIDGDSIVATVERVPDEVEPDPRIAGEAARIESETEAMLAEEIGRAEAPIDAVFIADVLRARMDAEIAVYASGQVIDVVPPGVVTRRALWAASSSTANPAVTRMSGAQLADLLARANDPAFVAETPRPLRGRARGEIVAVGLPPGGLEPEREYVVAGTDWELEPYAGYVRPEWGLSTRFDFPIIVREAVEEHLAG